MAKRIAKEVHYEAEANVTYPMAFMGNEVIDAAHTWVSEVIKQRDFKWQQMGGLGAYVQLDSYVNNKIDDLVPLCDRDSCLMNIELEGIGNGDVDEAILVMNCGTFSAKTNKEADELAAGCHAHYETVRGHFAEWVTETAVGIRGANEAIKTAAAVISEQKTNLQRLA